MAIIESIGDNVYEAVLRAAREKEKSYHEAVKEFLEVFVELVTARKKEVFDWAVANMHIKNVESFKKGQDQAVEAYLNAKEKYKIEPKNFSTGLRPTRKYMRKTRRTSSAQFEINDLKKVSDIYNHGKHRDYGWRGYVERHGFYRGQLSGESAWRGRQGCT